MKKSGLLLVWLVCAVPSTAGAADLKSGWIVNFQQETFSGDIIVGGYTSETSDEFQKAGISYVCTNGGRAFAFYPRGFGFEQGVSVDFRAGETTLNVSFSVAEVPGLGKSRVASEQDTAAIKDLFTEATSDIAFREGEDSGTFSVIGAGETFGIVDERC